MINFKAFFFCFFFCFVFANGLRIIWNKYELDNKLMLFSMHIKSKFIYKLSGCEFCIIHHLGIIPVVILFLMGFKDCINIFIPFLVSSGLNLIKTIYNAKN